MAPPRLASVGVPVAPAPTLLVVLELGLALSPPHPAAATAHSIAATVATDRTALLGPPRVFGISPPLARPCPSRGLGAIVERGGAARRFVGGWSAAPGAPYERAG